MADADLVTLRTAAGPTRPSAWLVEGAYRDGAGEGPFEDRFAGDGDLYLFGTILNEFVSLYAALNSFTRLTLRGVYPTASAQIRL